MKPLSAPIAAAPDKRFQLEQLREAWQFQLLADTALPISCLRVGVALCWYMNRRKRGLAWPSMATLAVRTRLSARTVMRAIKWLEDGKHLRVVRSWGADGRRNANRYQPLLKSETFHRNGAVTAAKMSGGSDTSM